LLTGNAGSGKSTIANTVCHYFDKDDEFLDDEMPNILQATYYFSRQFEDTRRQKYIITTLVYQLARHSNPLRVLCLTLTNSTRWRYPLRNCKAVLSGPWQESADDRPHDLPPYLIVVDALDEIDEGGGLATGHSSFLSLVDSVKMMKLLHFATTFHLRSSVVCTRSLKKMSVRIF
jgi:hypothetical protein